jgi:hypothetical protein
MHVRKRSLLTSTHLQFEFTAQPVVRILPTANFVQLSQLQTEWQLLPTVHTWKYTTICPL